MDFARLSPYVRDFTQRLERAGVEAAKLGELVNDYADHLVEALEEVAAALENEGNERSESDEGTEAGSETGGTETTPLSNQDMYRYLCSRNNQLYNNTLVREILLDNTYLLKKHYDWQKNVEDGDPNPWG